MSEKWNGGDPLGGPEGDDEKNKPKELTPEEREQQANMARLIAKPTVFDVGEDVGYEPGSRRFFGKPMPPERRCVALKRNCVCGYHYVKSDLWDEDGKRKDPADPCPQCGRERPQCANPKLKGFQVCAIHGGRAMKAKKENAIIPVRIHLDDDDIEAIERMTEENDTSLKREFHTLRMIFGKSLNEFELNYRAHSETGLTKVIGAAIKLTDMIQKLAQIADRVAKSRELLTPEDQLTRVEFDDPRVKYLIKEMIRDKQAETITMVLQAVLKALDPTGEKKIVESIPPSFYSYLPSEVVPKGVDLNVEGEAR